MSFFDFLKGKEKLPATKYDLYNSYPQAKKMPGTERIISESIESWIAAGNLSTQHLDTEQTFLKNFPFTMEKLSMFLSQFADEAFIFEREIKFMAVYWFVVDKSLVGGINASLFSQTAEEVSSYTKKMGEPPDLAGDMSLVFYDEKACIKTNNFRNKSTVDAIWFNQNWMDLATSKEFPSITYKGIMDL